MQTLEYELDLVKAYDILLQFYKMKDYKNVNKIKKGSDKSLA